MATGTSSAATPHVKPMNEIHRAILRICRQALVRDMNPELVLRKIADPNLFSEDEEAEIKANSLTRQQQCEKLLDILPTKGSNAYEIFKKTIKKVHPPLFSTIVEAAIHHYKTSKEPTEPQSVEDILHEIRDLQECLQQKEKEELRRMLKQLKGMILQTQQLVGKTCSRCSESESALDALRRRTDDKIKEYEKVITNLKTAKNELEPLEKDVNEDESNTEGRGETCPRCSKWERVFDAFRTEQIKEYEEKIRRLKRAKDELEGPKKDVNNEEGNTEGGEKTCSRCSEWESVLDVLTRKDDKINKCEDEIRSLKTVKDELERLKKDVNEEESNTEGGGKTCSRCSKWEKEFDFIRR